jgi:rod shape-determining protein MreC
VKGTLVIVAAILLLVLSFLLFTNINPFARAYSNAKVSAADIIGPTLRVLGAPARAVQYVFDSYFNLVGVKEKNAELRKKMESLQVESQKLPELERENQRLRSLLKLTEQKHNSMIAARVIGEDVVNWFKCIIIDKGKDQGVREKMPVITPAGVVGQAVEVSRWHSKVMIINDTNSAIDAYVSGKQTRGIIEGTGQTTLKMKYVRKNDEIEVGDKLITSGKDGIYPKGMAIGLVIVVNKNSPGLFAEVEVMPYNNFRKLDEVLVVKR